MLSDEQVIAEALADLRFYKHGNTTAVPYDYALAAVRKVADRLRAVEAAVRADQIEKDARIAAKYWPASPAWAHDVSAAIRAQLPAIVSEPSLTAEEQLLHDIFTGGDGATDE